MLRATVPANELEVGQVLTSNIELRCGVDVITGSAGVVSKKAYAENRIYQIYFRNLLGKLPLVTKRECKQAYCTVCILEKLRIH